MPSVIGVSVNVTLYIELVIFFPFFLPFNNIEDLTGSISDFRPEFIKHGAIPDDLSNIHQMETLCRFSGHSHNRHKVNINQAYTK